jgi:hypothetical protein
MFNTLLSEFRREGSGAGTSDDVDADADADVAPARFLTKSNTDRMIVDSIPRPVTNEVVIVTVLTAAVETVVVEIIPWMPPFLYFTVLYFAARSKINTKKTRQGIILYW